MGQNAKQSSGSVFRGAKPDLWYFDQLPPSARAALANAAFSWSSGADRWKKGAKGYGTGQQVAERVREWDAAQIKIDRKRVWGIGARPVDRKPA